MACVSLYGAIAARGATGEFVVTTGAYSAEHKVKLR